MNQVRSQEQRNAASLRQPRPVSGCSSCPHNSKSGYDLILWTYSNDLRLASWASFAHAHVGTTSGIPEYVVHWKREDELADVFPVRCKIRANTALLTAQERTS
ncbi:hypothetical protein LSAT2_021870 [Lamellibrachia satsuma]|nr:hypothetical protein LSAT2_021870 [Lamellibrachia satsuma]